MPQKTDLTAAEDHTLSQTAESLRLAVEVLSDGVSLWFTVPLPEGIDMTSAEVSRSYLGTDYEVEVDQELVLHERSPKAEE